MKTIIEVKIDDDKIYANIDGPNRDLLVGIAHIIDAIEEAGTDISRENAIGFIKGYLGEMDKC